MVALDLKHQTRVCRLYPCHPGTEIAYFMSSTKENWCCCSLEDAELWAAKQLGADAPTFVRECRIEADKCLTRCTMFVYALTLFAVVTYTICGVELTESGPAAVSLAPRSVPQFAIEPSYLNQTPEYCHPYLAWKYKCENDGSWHAIPTGCANIPTAHIPQWRISQESGDGIFVPTAWNYEESQLQPMSGQCNQSQCVESEHRGPQGQRFCKCTKISEKLFVPWTEHNASFAYQMQLEIPDLEVMKFGALSTPFCESFLRDDQFKKYSGCPVGDEECLRTSTGASSMPCRVFLRIPEQKQGHPFNDIIAQDPNPMPLHNTEYFSTDLWGLWTVNVSKVLRRFTDLTQSVFLDPHYGNPLLCSFISTGASTDQYLINMYIYRSPTISELQTECEVDCHVGQSL